MIKDARNNGKEDKEIPTEDGHRDSKGHAPGAVFPKEEENDAGRAEADDLGKKADGDAKAPNEEIRRLEEEISRKKEEIDALKDILKRRQADFENYKKRVIKSQEEYRKGAIKDMALDIIDINDDLLRAIEAACEVCEGERLLNVHNSFVDGVSMISRRIEEVLLKYGIIEIKPLGAAFDPNSSEAVEIDESPEVDQDTVTKVYRKGFSFDNYILRSARVRVTRPLKKKPEADNAQEENKDSQENK